MQLCRLRNAGRLWLEVRESNGEARETYRRLGNSSNAIEAFEPLPPMQALLSRYYGKRITLHHNALGDAVGPLMVPELRGRLTTTIF